MKTNAERQKSYRSRQPAMLRVPISAKAKLQLVSIAARKGFTHRAVIEWLLDRAEKEIFK